MPKDAKSLCKRRTFADPRTGREVWQATDWNANQTATYMYAQAFSKEEQYLAFVSDIGGRCALYRLDLATGETVQLTDDGHAGHLAISVHPNGEEVFYIDGARRELRAVHFVTRRDRLIAAVTRPEWKSVAGIPGFSGNGRKVCCSFHTKDDRGGVAVADAEGGDFEEVFLRAEDIQHVQFCPGTGYLMTFAVLPDYQNNPEGDAARRARAWALDYPTRQARPFLHMPVGFRATHEFWSPDGTRLFFHKKTHPTWTPNWVCSINADGGDFREHFRSDTRRLGHSCLSPDGRRLVVDSQDPGENELYLVDLRTGAAEVLCWPNASIANGATGHVHPSFSPSGTKVLYTSDAGGNAQIYIVPIR